MTWARRRRWRPAPRPTKPLIYRDALKLLRPDVAAGLERDELRCIEPDMDDGLFPRRDSGTTRGPRL